MHDWYAAFSLLYLCPYVRFLQLITAVLVWGTYANIDKVSPSTAMLSLLCLPTSVRMSSAVFCSPAFGSFMFCWKRRSLVTQKAKGWEVCKGIPQSNIFCVFISLWEVCFRSLQLVRFVLGHEGEGEESSALIDILEWQVFMKKLLTGPSADRNTLFWHWGPSKPNRTLHLNLIVPVRVCKCKSLSEACWRWSRVWRVCLQRMCFF